MWARGHLHLCINDGSVFEIIKNYLFFSPQEGPQRKKRKSEAVGTSNQADLLALGTAVGSVLLYSTVKGELHSKLIVSTYLCMYVLYKREMLGN